jgi:hypothetical protein
VLGGLRNVEAAIAPSGDDGVWRLVVRPAAAEAQVRQDVLVAAVENKLRLTTLRPIVPSLDDIYRSAVVERAA